FAISFPSKKMDPPVGLVSLRSSRPVVVFPLPLSPARPIISPLRTLKLMPSTALTVASSLDSIVSRKPFLSGKYFFRFSTRSTNSSLSSLNCSLLSPRDPHLLVEMARDEVIACARLLEWGIDLLADIHDVGASGVEPASRWRVEQVRGLARYRGEADPRSLDTGECFDEALGVRVEWFSEDGLRVPILDYSSSVHYRHLLAGLGDDREAWPIKTKEEPRFPLRARRKFRGWAWTNTSSAVPGPFAMRSLGLAARAKANSALRP